MNKIIRLFNTVKFLKQKQINYRLFYFIRNKYRNKIGFKYPIFSNVNASNLNLDKSIFSYKSFTNKKEFSFLNLNKKFQNCIDWNFSDYGKLWTYNLNYFDFLNQEKLEIKESLFLLNDFISHSNLKDAQEPFPISLRGINWIKFFTYNNISNKKFNDKLFSDYMILLDNIEYHLLGNHLLENGFSLLFASYYFENEELYKKAKDILITELDEQILADGAHFELSPMYHQIMLYRLLDCINLTKNNKYKEHELLEFFRIKASLMLSWLENIIYKNGDIPLLNDSTNGIAPISSELFSYAKRLDIKYENSELSESGYRKFNRKNYESIIDIGNIGPSYIPGHAHSDTFNFELYKNDNPFIVDTGLSTYESNNRRFLDRCTSSHNTVVVNNKEQSEIWGAFRVANRASIVNLSVNSDFVMATHNGYKKDNVLHTRKWKFNDESIIIEDFLSNDTNAVSYLHFHPNVEKKDIEKCIKIDAKYEIEEYKYCLGFNKYKKALKLKTKFNKELKMEIKI